MSFHLDDVALALLADHAASEAEQLHLATCAECAARVDAYRQLTGALRALPDLVAPASVRDGVLAHGSSLRVVTIPSRRRLWLRSGIGVAAAVALFAGGYFMGQRKPASDTFARVDSVADRASPENLMTRAAALEALTLTAEAALRDAPTDPIILAHYNQARRDRDMLRRRVQVVSRPAHWF